MTHLPRYRHYRVVTDDGSPLPRGGATACAVRVPYPWANHPGVPDRWALVVGVAVCSPQDAFSRLVGRELAYERVFGLRDGGTFGLHRGPATFVYPSDQALECEAPRTVRETVRVATERLRARLHRRELRLAGVDEPEPTYADAADGSGWACSVVDDVRERTWPGPVSGVDVDAMLTGRCLDAFRPYHPNRGESRGTDYRDLSPAVRAQRWADAIVEADGLGDGDRWQLSVLLRGVIDPAWRVTALVRPDR